MKTLLHIHLINKALDKNINSRAWSVLMFLLVLSRYHTFSDRATIIGFNRFRLYKIMKSYGISTSPSQINKSIQELRAAELISYTKLPDEYNHVHDQVIGSALVINYTEKELGKFTDVKVNPYIELNPHLLSKEFYTMHVRPKRLVMYALSHFTSVTTKKEATDTTININFTKGANLDMSINLFGINSQKKLIKHLSSTQSFINITRLSAYSDSYNNNVYRVRLSPKYISSIGGSTVTKTNITSYDESLLTMVDDFSSEFDIKLKAQEKVLLIKEILLLKKREAAEAIILFFANFDNDTSDNDSKFAYLSSIAVSVHAHAISDMAHLSLTNI